jgi:sigma-54 dependent transcriptional regulator, acetoin dehydrogenase operon transcriptional activator AcoR
MILEKKFREDLFYRLNVIPLSLSPLRERQEDILDLANFFALRYGKLSGKQVWKITDNTIQYLLEYSWPGNVRELENVLEFMVNMMGDEGILDEFTLPKEIKQFIKESKQPGKIIEDNHYEVRTLKQLEYLEIMKALKKYGESTEGKRLAAKQLGISLATLYRKSENAIISNNEN